MITTNRHFSGNLRKRRIIPFKRNGQWIAVWSFLLLALCFGTMGNAQESTENLLQVTSHPAEDLAPKLSPDGKWLAFVSKRSGNYDIWLKNMETGFMRQLTTHHADDFYPVWDQRQRYIIYVSQQSDAHGDLFRLNLRNVLGELIPKGEPERLTFYMGFDGYPTMSEIDEHIAWVSDRTGRPEIWLQTKRRKEVRQLTHGGATHPAWSPKQGYLAFTSFRDAQSNGDIWLINLYAPFELFDKKTAIDSLERPMWPITEGPAVDGFATWSADAKTVLFSRHDYDTNGDGRLSPADNSVLWTVDVSHLPVDSMRVSTPSFEMFRDTFDERIALSARPVTPVYYDARQPSWSSTNKTFFISTLKGNADVWSCNADTFFTLPTSSQPLFSIDNLFPLPRSLESRELDSLYAVRSTLTADEQHQLWDRVTALHQIIDADSVAESVQAAALYEAGICHTLLGYDERANFYYTYIVNTFPNAKEQVAWAEVILQTETSLTRNSTYNDVINELIAVIEPLQVKYADEPAFLAQTDILLGNLWMAKKEIQRARIQYERVEKMYAQFPAYCAESLFLLGVSYEKNGEFDAAMATFFAVLQKYEDETEWARQARNRYMVLSLRMAQTDRQRIALYNKVHNDLRDFGELSIEPLFRAAALLADNEQVDDALAVYDSIRINYADMPEQVFNARFRQAELLLHTGEIVAAAENLTKLAEDYETVSPRLSRQATDRLVELLLTSAADLKRSQNWAIALIRYQRVLALAPYNVKAHQGYVESLFYLGRIDQAVEEYEALVEQHSNNNILLYALGLAYSFRGTPQRDDFFTPADVRADDLEHSNEFLREALSFDYNFVEAYLTLSYNYEMLENHLRWQKDRPRSFWHKTGSALVSPFVWLYQTVTFYNETRAPRYYETSIQILTSALSLNDEEQRPDLEALIALNMANNYYNIGEFGFDKAYEFYHLRLKYDSTFVDSRQEALIMERMGHCAMVVEDAERGPAYLERAIELYRQRNIPDRVLINTKRLALLYEFTRNSPQALLYYQQAADMENQRRLYDGLLRSYRSLAYHHYLLNHKDDAVLYANRGLALLDEGLVARSEGKPLRPQFGILGIYFPIPFDLRKVGAKSVLQLSTDEEEAILYSILASTFQEERQFDEAISFYEKKLKIYEQRFDYDAQAIFQNNMAFLYFIQGDYDNAWKWFTNSYWMCVKTKNLGGQLLNITNAAHVVLTIAEEPDESRRINLSKYHNWITGRVNNLLKVTNENPTLYAQNRLHLNILAADLVMVHPQADDSDDLTANMTGSLRSIKNASTANAYLLQALAIARDKVYVEEECAVLLKRGTVLQTLGAFAEARDEFIACRNLAAQHQLSDVLWRVNTAIGQILNAAQKEGASALSMPNEPIYYFQQAITISEAHRQPMPGLSAARRRLLVQEPYREVIQLHIENGRIDEALKLAERMRERHVFDLLTAGDIHFDARHQQLYDRLDSLQQDITDVQRVLQSNSLPKEDLVKQQQRLQDLRRQFNNALEQMRQEAPELEHFVLLSPVEVHNVQERLPDSLAIIYHVAQEDQSLFWTVRKDTITFESIHLDKKSALERMRSVRRMPQEFMPLFRTAANNANAIVFVPDYDFMMFPWFSVSPAASAGVPSLTISSSLTSFAQVLNNERPVGQSIYVAGGLDTTALRGKGYEIIDPIPQQTGNAFQAQRSVLARADIIHLDAQADWNPMTPPASSIKFNIPESQPATIALSDMFALSSSQATHLSLNIVNNSIPSAEAFIALERAILFNGIPSLLLTNQAALDSTGSFYRQFYEHLSGDLSTDTFQFIVNASEAQTKKDSSQFMQMYGLLGQSDAIDPRGIALESENLRNRAEAAFENGQWEEALQLYVQINATMTSQDELLFSRLLTSALNSGRWDDAISIEQQRIERQKRLNNWQTVADAYRQIAVLQDYRGQNQAASSARAEYQRLVRQYGLEYDMAAPWQTLATILYDGGNNRLSIEFFRRAASAYEQQGDRIAQVSMLRRIGQIYAQNLHAVKKALDVLNEALTVLPGDADLKTRAYILMDKSRACFDFSLDVMAKDFAEQAHAIATEMNDQHLQNECKVLLAQILFELGDMTVASDLVHDIPLDTSAPFVVDALLLQSRFATEQDQPEEAIRLARQAVNVADRLQDAHLQTKSTLFLAALYWFQQSTDEAVLMVERLLRSHNGRNSQNRAHALVAAMLIDSGEYERAQQHVQSVQTGMHEENNATERALYYYLSSLANEKDVASQLADRAIAVADSLALSDILWRAEWRRAHLAASHQQDSTATHFYQKALATLVASPPSTHFEHVLHGLAETEEHFIQDYVNYWIQSGKTTTALNGVEMASRRSILLRDFWHRQAFYQSADETAKRDTLRQELALVRAELLLDENRSDSARFLSLHNRFETAQENLMSSHRVEPAEQRFGGSVHDSLNTLALKQSLPEDLVLLRTYYDENNLHYWLITRDSVHYVGHPVDLVTLNQNVMELQQRLNAHEPIGQISNDLYRDLLSFVSPHLSQKSKLMIVPFGVLYALPFAVLTPDDAAPLGLEKEISYANYLSGSFQMDAPIPPSSIAAMYSYTETAPDLSLSENVANSLKRYFQNVKILERDDFIDISLPALQQNHDAIYLGIGIHLNSSFPYAMHLQSPFMLNDRFSVFKTWLSNRSTSLLIFHAVHTDGSVFITGRYDANLTDALLRQTCQNIVLPQWTPDELAGSVLIKRFFRNIADGHSYADALRLAQKTVHDQIDAHPSAWAVYRLFGDF